MAHIDALPGLDVQSLSGPWMAATVDMCARCVKEASAGGDQMQDLAFGRNWAPAIAPSSARAPASRGTTGETGAGRGEAGEGGPLGGAGAGREGRGEPEDDRAGPAPEWLDMVRREALHRGCPCFGRRKLQKTE